VRAHGPPAVVFDIGASHGDFAGRVAELLPDAAIHCFEPGAQAFAHLERRFAGNPRVVLNRIAVAARAGTATLYDYSATPGSPHASLLAETFRDIYPAPAEGAEVATTALDAYAASRGIDRIDYLKIDVEGAERAVLEGARRLLAERRVDHVQLEFNAHAVLSGFTLLALSRLLAGYDLYRIVANGRVPAITAAVRYNTRIEIYKYANFLAVRQGLAPAP
jgi:FkbM family methyltransferase